MINHKGIKQMVRSREGFSLIELVIAIAVLAIFVGMISLSVALLRSADTRGLANRINDSFTDLKSSTEAHTGPVYLHIYKDADGYYASFDESPTFVNPDEDTDRLGPDSMRVDVNYDDGSSKILGDSKCESVTFAIQKKDGAFKQVDSSLPGVLSFDVRKGSSDESRVDYSVVISNKTGMHYVD